MKKILVLGSLNMDFVIQVKEMPKVGETILGESVRLVPGGKGANQAYAAGKLGGSVMMLGAVGEDAYGKMLMQNLKEVDVDTSGIAELDHIMTGQAFVSVYQSGDNSIIVVPGANGALTCEMVKQKEHYIDACDYIVMQLEIPLDVVRYVKNLAVEKGKKVILDPAPAVSGLEDSFWQGITLIKPNETELAILTGRTLHTKLEMQDAARELIQKGVETVLVTLGEKGCLLVREKESIHFPARKVDFVDTTAAGDSFLAAMVTALCEERTLEDAIQFAQNVSSIVVTRYGAQTSIPWREEVEEIMRQQEIECA